MVDQEHSKKQIIAILGPTAVGKTKIAIMLAKRLGTDIISADSRQCYQHMNIGTAKPTHSERAQVTHHLVDFLPLEKIYSAGDFEKDALRIATYLWTSLHQVILAGGSGLYIKALCQGLSPIPKVPRGLYDELTTLYKKKGLASLLKELANCDPDYYPQVLPNDHQRVIRAIAIYRTLKKPYSYYLSLQPKKRNFQVIKIGLNLSRDLLYQKINHRVDIMVEQGLFDEVQRLYQSYGNLPAFKTIGYQEVIQYLQGHLTRQQAIHYIKQHTRNYAKQQLTWFRKQKDIKWFSPSDLIGITSYLKSQVAL